MTPREPRRKVLAQARMRRGSIWEDVCIRNVSSRGLLLRTESPPEPGTYVEIRRLSQIIVGRSVWRHGQDFGIRTQDVVDVSAILTDAEWSGTGSPVPGVPHQVERRSDPQRRAGADVAWQFERSRQLSSAIQFLIVAAVGLAAAGFAAGMAYELLSQPLDAVQVHLAGRN
jgi:hypothetical protein